MEAVSLVSAESHSPRVMELRARFSHCLERNILASSESMDMELLSNYTTEARATISAATAEVMKHFRSNSQAEFDDVCTEYQLLDVLNNLDQISKDQTVQGHDSGEAATNRGLRLPLHPSATLAQKMHEAKDMERDRLAALLSQVKQERIKVGLLLEKWRMETTLLHTQLTNLECGEVQGNLFQRYAKGQHICTQHLEPRLCTETQS